MHIFFTFIFVYRITPPVSASPPEDGNSKPSPTKEEDVKPNNDSLEEASWADCVEDYLYVTTFAYYRLSRLVSLNRKFRNIF